MVSYLRNAPVTTTATRFAQDVLAPGQPHLRTLRLQSDGVWEWPSDLTHFVDKYNVELPDEFTQHMRAQNWSPPKEIHEIV
jgi:hypothetical protein